MTQFPAENGVDPLGRGRFVLGSAQWGMTYGIANRTGPPAPAEVTSMIRLAAAHGVNVIDTARDYGASEALIGDLHLDRRRWTLVTKLTADVLEPDDDLTAVLARADESVHRSRSTLHRRRLDVLLLHRGAHRRWSGGALWRHLRAAREDGRIGALGVSAVSPDEALEALEDPDVDVLQVAFSLFDRRLPPAFFERARQRRIRIMRRSVFLQGAGLLAPEELPPPLRALAPALRAVDDWAAQRRRTRRDVLLAYARDAAPGCVVVGCERTEQLQQHLQAWDLPPLDEAERRELEALVPALPDTVLDPWRWRSA